MNTTQEENWECLFGDTQVQYVNSSNLSQIVHQLAQGNQQEAIRNSVGQRLFELIEEEQNRVRQGHIKGKAKLQAQNALTALIRLAKLDVTHLGDAKERALLTSYFIFNEEALYQLNTLIYELDILQNEQVERLKTIQCVMKVKSIEIIKKQQNDSFYETLIRLIKAGDYLKSATSLLTHHCVYTAQQAENILMKTRQAATFHTEHAKDFLELVELRLQSPGSLKPNTIDYQSLKQNGLINNPLIVEYKVSELMTLCALSPFARTIRDSLWDIRLKERYIELIKNIDSITRNLAKSYPEKYYPMLAQHYEHHPNG